MLINRPWSVEFDDYGGYDCMWSAHKIKDSKGITILTVDVAIKTGSGDHHYENLEDKELAEYICKLVNEDKDDITRTGNTQESRNDPSIQRKV